MSMADRSFYEKRDYIRMRMEAPVTLIFNHQRIQATCRDLSSSGMQLEAPSALKVGDLVEVLIHSGNANIQDLQANARVVRVQTAESGIQTIGVEVTSMR